MITSFSLDFTVDSVAVSSETDVVVHVLNDPIFVNYSARVPADMAAAGYVGVPNETSESAIHLVDVSSDSIPSSSPLVDGEKEFNGNAFTYDTSSFELTDVFNIQGTLRQPLYYKHEIQSGSVLANSVKILDKDLKPVRDLYYKYDQNENIIFHSIDFNYSALDGTYEVFYASYVDQDTGGTRIELLRAAPLYREISVYAPSSDRSYVITGISATGVNVAINRVPATDRAVRRSAQNRLAVLKPAQKELNESWALRVTNADVIANGHRYRVPEYYSQGFSPYAPFNIAFEEKAIVLQSDLIKVHHEPIVTSEMAGIYDSIDSSSFKIDVVVYSKDGVLKFAATNDIGKLSRGEFYRDGAQATLWRNLVNSVSGRAGFVKLDANIQLDDLVYATYSYVNNYFDIDFEMNPAADSRILNRSLVVAAYPDPLDSGVGIYWLLISQDGSDAVIVEASPSAPGGLVGSTYDTYVTSYVTAQDHIVLARASVGLSSDLGQVQTIDSRVFGGGIKEDFREQALVSFPEAYSYLDLGYEDGFPYPANYVQLLRIPQKVLNTLTPSQVRDVSKRHLVSGSYPLVDFYGVKPIITGATYESTGSFTISWKDVGNDYTINVYHADSLALDPVLVTTTATGATSYTFSGLTTTDPFGQNITHYVYLVPVHIATGELGQQSETLMMVID